MARRWSHWGTAPEGSGGGSKYPWYWSQPAPFRNRNCSSVSTPSATTVRPRAWTSSIGRRVRTGRSRSSGPVLECAVELDNGDRKRPEVAEHGMAGAGPLRLQLCRVGMGDRWGTVERGRDATRGKGNPAPASSGLALSPVTDGQRRGANGQKTEERQRKQRPGEVGARKTGEGRAHGIGSIGRW
jgi:hypothetical protein